MKLMEESCELSSEGNYRSALEKAKEASNKERNLIKSQDQVGLTENHNMDLTYTVDTKLVKSGTDDLFKFLDFIYSG